MYETADMMHGNTRAVVAGIIKEMRAEVPEWTRDGIRPGGKRATPATRKPAVPARKAAAPAAAKPKPTPAPAARKMRATAAEINASLRETIRKCEVDIARIKYKIDQLNGDIRHMTNMFIPQNNKLLTQKQQERGELWQKIEKLQKIRDDCEKLLKK